MLKGLRPMPASIAIALMLGCGIGTIVVGFYFFAVLLVPAWGISFVTVSLLDVLLTWMLGFIYTYGGWALRKDQSWGWGAGVFGGVLYLLLWWPIEPFVLSPFLALAVIVIALLFSVREYYGMVRPDPEEEERTRQRLRDERTANPARLHCPRCGSTDLWISPDGSAYCQSCRAGIISARPSA